MDIKYRHKPGEFRELISEEYPLIDTLGKSEYEQIALQFLKTAVRRRAWPALRITSVHTAEEMADAGYLFRCESPIEVQNWRGVYWQKAGRYQITNEALEAILKRKTPRKGL